MFGIIRPCGEHGCPSLRAAWQAHLCGLCLTLRDGQGQAARLATNYDTLIISVLTEAQLPSAGLRRMAGPCALRGFRAAEVVDARASGARLAAAVSLALGAGRLRDHVADGDAVPGTALGAASGTASGATFGTAVGTAFGAALGTALGAARRGLAARWEAGGARLGAGVGFDTAVLVSTVDRQLDLERRVAAQGGGRVLELTAPTEEAVAAAFAHTAVLAGRPGNAAALAEAGRFFGRIAHLLDAVEDRAADAARGAFNPLTATGTGEREARRLCDDAVHGLALALREVEFEERHLVDTLLGTEVRRAVERAFRDSYERPGWIRKSAAGALTILTCGRWQPRWSRTIGRRRKDGCFLRDLDCSCCDCCNCCDCSCST
ncbi:DUF5685 family protein [Nonomuraea sp. NPDC005650]|uniref:DUF5685 family protein n=1 Tax=Nonomuraea sp. NPDC005650 TaxID=3157045 RepID=UPI0033A8E524